MFGAEESAIQELIAGVKQGYLVQAHTHEVDECGCPCMGDVVAAFLIGAGEDRWAQRLHALAAVANQSV